MKRSKPITNGHTQKERAIAFLALWSYGLFHLMGFFDSPLSRGIEREDRLYMVPGALLFLGTAYAMLVLADRESVSARAWFRIFEVSNIVAVAAGVVGFLTGQAVRVIAQDTPVIEGCPSSVTTHVAPTLESAMPARGQPPV